MYFAGENKHIFQVQYNLVNPDLKNVELLKIRHFFKTILHQGLARASPRATEGEACTRWLPLPSTTPHCPSACGRCYLPRPDTLGPAAAPV